MQVHHCILLDQMYNFISHMYGRGLGPLKKKVRIITPPQKIFFINFFFFSGPNPLPYIWSKLNTGLKKN